MSRDDDAVNVFVCLPFSFSGGKKMIFRVVICDVSFSLSRARMRSTYWTHLSFSPLNDVDVVTPLEFNIPRTNCSAIIDVSRILVFYGISTWAPIRLLFFPVRRRSRHLQWSFPR